MSIILKISAKGGKRPRRGIDHYWSIIMDLEMQGKTFSVSGILASSDPGVRTDIRDFVKRLLRAGIIKIEGLLPEGEFYYRVIERQDAAPRVRRDGTIIEGATRQQCLWNAIRSSAMRQSFNADDLVAWGSTDAVKLKRATVLSYLQTLAAAGYLIQLDKGGPGRLATWRLDPSMNTGPLPPRILRTKVVYDPNRGEIVGGAIDTKEESV